MTAHLLFVYGTLRLGFESGPARRLRDGASHLGKASCRGCLYRVGLYPGLVKSALRNDRVVGDLFHLQSPRDTLRRLDRYEGITPAAAQPEFMRRRHRVRLENGDRVIAWTYFYNRPVKGRRRIRGGDFLASPRN